MYEETGDFWWVPWAHPIVSPIIHFSFLLSLSVLQELNKEKKNNSNSYSKVGGNRGGGVWGMQYRVIANNVVYSIAPPRYSVFNSKQIASA